MRITCPSCSSSFEIPAELLGKKGRALKCASCGHSWYQAAQVDSLDLASIMGNDYAAKAKAAAGSKMRNERLPAGQAAPQRAPQGPPPLPPGAVSMVNRNQQGRPNQQAASAGQRAPQQRHIQQAGLGAPKSKAVAKAAALPGHSMRGADGKTAPGQDAVSWMHPVGAQGGPGAPQAVPGGQQSMPQPGARGGPGAPPGQLGQAPPQSPGAQGGPGTSPLGQPGQASPQSPGAQGGPGAPGQSMAGPGGTQGGPGAPGQSVRGPDAMAAPGEGAVSWMEKNEGGPGAPGQSMAGPGGAQGGPGAPGQSMRGPDGGAGPGEDAVSWMDKDKAAGAAGESMMDAGASGGPGQGPGAKGADGAPAGEEEGRAAKAEGGLLESVARAKKSEAELLEGETRGNKSEAELSDGEAANDDLNGESPEMGTSGGPGAAKNPDDDASDEDLVDPDADRPDFGSAEDEDADGDDEGDDGSDEDEDAEESFESVATRAGGKRGSRKKRGKPIDPAYVTAGIMGAAVISLALMVWFGRGLLMDLWPGFAGFYDSVGMEAEQPGGGLSISETGKRLVRVGGVETLVVRGFVSNVSDVAKSVPGLRLELFDQQDEVIQDVTTSTATALLDPGGTVEYELRMQLPQLDAAEGYRVVWDND